jgi:membrane protein implicated in regulation of membrane protease activity
MTSDARGIRPAARRVAGHLSALSRLQKELARTELRQKGATAGAGAGLGIAAGLLALYAIGFGLAAVAAALALVVDWWLALLIVFVALVLSVVTLALVARGLLRKAGSLKPEQALEEARLTKDTLRGLGAG